MPTFRNDGERPVIYNDPNGTEIIIFDPGKDVQLIRWVPYKKLGLTLVSESYPAVPDTVLISGEFKFTKGMKRRFEIEPCDGYSLNVNPLKGSITLYCGASKHGYLYTNNTFYSGSFSWKYAPYLIIVCNSDEAIVDIRASIKE